MSLTTTKQVNLVFSKKTPIFYILYTNIEWSVHCMSVILGDKAAYQPAKIQWTSEKKLVGVEGEPVKFMCIFSG